MIDLSAVFRELSRGKLTFLDLTGSLRDHDIQNVAQPKMNEIGAINQPMTQRLLWETVINGRGTYEKTWKLPTPPQATEIKIHQVCPLIDGSLVATGSYVEEKSRFIWVMTFNREGKCLMNWSEMLPYGDSMITIMPRNRFAVIFLKTLCIFDIEGQLLQKYDEAINFVVLDSDKYVVGLSDKIVFINDQLIPFHTYPEHRKTSIGRCISVSYNGKPHLGVVETTEWEELVESWTNYTAIIKQSTCSIFNDSGAQLMVKSLKSSQRKVHIDGQYNGVYGESFASFSDLGFWSVENYSDRRSIWNFNHWDSSVEKDRTAPPLPFTAPSTIGNIQAPDGHLYTWKENEISVTFNYQSHPIQPLVYEQLWDALESNQTIKVAQFAGWPLGDKGASRIADMIRKNSTLRKIDLSGTDIGDIGASQLLVALKAHKFFISLELRGNPISTHMMAHFDAFGSQRLRQNLPKGAVLKGTKIEIPSEFYCTLTHLVMIDPVSTMEGDTYEREAITKWLETNDTCPNSNVKLENKNLTPNKALKRQIVTFLDNNPFFRAGDELYFPRSIQKSCLNAVEQGDEKELIKLIEQESRLLGKPLEGDDGSSETLLSKVSRNGPLSLLQIVLKKMGTEGIKRLHTLPDGWEVECFKNAGMKMGVQGAKTLGDAFQWNSADYQDRLFEALAENDAPYVDLCAAIAPLDGLNENGQTPLHSAIKNDSQMAVEILLRHGGSPDLLNVDGISAAELAKTLKRSHLLRLQPTTETLATESFMELIRTQRAEIEQLKKDHALLKQQMAQMKSPVEHLPDKSQKTSLMKF